MILIKQYAKDKWEKFSKDKLGIKGYFNNSIPSKSTFAPTVDRYQFPWRIFSILLFR